ncbi:hypothetical protein Clacol_002072 [Clathrus columnatus]|uniref:Uncharacterized protein n=1 Tax=Clathrus columnatus TaxID=1419009 RepID=A0AAV5A5J5_9AGAM|nr:hypothetical protein Clacol_002072 [Clathrus columnatus]
MTDQLYKVYIYDFTTEDAHVPSLVLPLLKIPTSLPRVFVTTPLRWLLCVTGFILDCRGHFISYDGPDEDEDEDMDLVTETNALMPPSPPAASDGDNSDKTKMKRSILLNLDQELDSQTFSTKQGNDEQKKTVGVTLDGDVIRLGHHDWGERSSYCGCGSERKKEEESQSFFKEDDGGERAKKLQETVEPNRPEKGKGKGKGKD